MQLTRVLNALNKNKITVTKVDKWGTGCFTWIAKKGDRELEFRENGAGSGHVLTFVARHPDTDSSVDLFMDSYFETIKYAVQYLQGGK
jgi:hypothetical protein